MAEFVIAQNEAVEFVTYALPNKHYVPVDMQYMGVENVQPCVLFLFTLGIPSPVVLLCEMLTLLP